MNRSSMAARGLMQSAVQGSRRRSAVRATKPAPAKPIAVPKARKSAA